MQENKYSDLMQKIELEELSTNIDVDSYIQLLAIYLYQDKIADAKFLWKRMPQALKKDNIVLERLNLVMCALIANNATDFFRQVDYPWSGNIKHIMQDLFERMRRDVLTLVGQAYISIFEYELMQLTHLSRDELKQTCHALDWKYENEDQKAVIIPRKAAPNTEFTASSEDLLLKLTDFVSFLEN
nr:COP9 signalosome complex subunit 8 [Bactrocera oleae]